MRSKFVWTILGTRCFHNFRARDNYNFWMQDIFSFWVRDLFEHEMNYIFCARAKFGAICEHAIKWPTDDLCFHVDGESWRDKYLNFSTFKIRDFHITELACMLLQEIAKRSPIIIAKVISDELCVQATSPWVIYLGWSQQMLHK